MALLNSSKIAIINGNIFIQDRFQKGIIFIENDQIREVLFTADSVDQLGEYDIIDAEDGYVSYGFMDPHVHFRTPGFEYKEDWLSGPKAAVKGGFTYVIDMPNTTPATVDNETMRLKYDLAKASMVHFGFHLGLTRSNADQIKTCYQQAKESQLPVFGIKVFLGSSTGSLLIENSQSVKEALASGIINLYHCEEESVLKKYQSVPYRSIMDHHVKRPAEAEMQAFLKIMRACEDVKKQARIYICHVSSEKLVRAIKDYRKKGYRIIAEVTPHHLFFNVEDFDQPSNIYKVNPPIREKKDVGFLREAFNDGVFQVIGTDHAPHLLKEKQSENPPSGMPGLESAFYALYHLYEKKELSISQIFKSLTSAYQIFDIKQRGEIKKNNFADITIIKKKNYTFKTQDTFTKSDFSPYNGLKSSVQVDTVLVNGKIVLRNGDFV